MPKSKSNEPPRSTPRRKINPEIGSGARGTRPVGIGSRTVSTGGRHVVSAVIPVPEPATSVGIDRAIGEGCYVIRYEPAEPSPEVLFFEGTARIMRVGVNGQRDPKGETRGGADLYCRLRHDPDLSKKDPVEWALRDPAQWSTQKDKSIPILSRALYRYYLEVTSIMEDAPAKDNVSFSFSIHEFQQNTEWPNPGNRWVCLEKVQPPGSDEFWAGNVLDQDSGQIVGTLSLCWISENLRRAIISIHRANGVKFIPGEHLGGKGASAQDQWAEVFKQAGWALELETQEKPDLTLVSSDRTWTIGDLQQTLHAMEIEQTVGEEAASKAEQGFKLIERMTPQEIQQRFPQLAYLPNHLDTEWRYHLLCVPKIEGFDRGVMFDTYGSDSENLPRDGAAVAAEWRFGDDATSILENHPSQAERNRAQEIQRRWQPEVKKQLQQVARAYFRVAVHEIGHAMGLDHNFKDYGFMNTTDSIADASLEKREHALTLNIHASQLASLQNSSQPTEIVSRLLEDAERLGVVPGSFEKSKLFPGLIELGFQADDLNQLRFGPDISVRPGTSYHDAGPLSAGVAATPGDGLELEVSSALQSVPFGAPARIKLKITNTSNQLQKIPNSLSLKTGVVAGSVVDPHGNERTFWPLKRGEDSDPGGVLAPSETRTYTMTLLRGAQKALFPMAGDHRVKVIANWQRGAENVYLQGEAALRVTPPLDNNHRAAALKILSTPDTLLSLAVVGDQFPEGTSAIDAALANPVLAPHFAVIRAKLYLTGPLKVLPDKACDLIDDSTVMSFDEIDSFSDLLCNKYESGGGRDLTKLGAAVAYLQKRVVRLRKEGAIENQRADNVWNRLDGFIRAIRPQRASQAGQIPPP